MFDKVNTKLNRVMGTKKESPKINSIAWGKIITADGNTYKDAKLFPGGSREWDWNETGTRHSPGTQPTDVEELITHGAQQVILSQGYHQRLGVCQETTDLLTNKGITFYILETSKAVKKYNSIRKKYPTGALIHSTC